MSDQPDFGKELEDKIWITRGARFNAARRLEQQHQLSTLSRALLSVYVVIATLIVQFNIFDLTEKQDLVISIGIIGASLLILTMGLYESGRTYKLRSSRLHQCATQLSKVLSAVKSVRTSELTKTERHTELTALNAKYDALVESYDDNHEPSDHKLFIACNPDAEANRFVAFIKQQWIRLSYTFFYLVLILAPFIALIWMLFEGLE